MLEAQPIDLRGLENLMAGLRDALIASGQGGDASQVTGDEARRLAMDIANDLLTKNKANAEKKIRRDVGAFLSEPWDENIEEENRGDGTMVWLVAGPRFLYGVAPVDYDLHGAGTEAAMQAFRQERSGGIKRSKHMIKLGTRGRQTVYRKDRIIVPKSSFRGVVKNISAHLGRLAASFAQTASNLGQGEIKQAISKHFPSPKNIHQDRLSDSASPSITFGSRSPGVTKPFVQQVVSRRVQIRKAKIRARIKLILRGYASDARRGQRPRRRAKETGE
jgi:hypothetical protein